VTTSFRRLALHALIASVAVARADAAPACERAVRVSGDAEAAAEVRTRLANRGVADGGVGCAPVRARVDRTGDGLRVEVVDGSGRRSERDVRDAATAVALIESWIEPEVVVGELATPARLDTTPVVAAARPRAGSPAAGVMIVVGPARADDDSTWVVGAAGACGTIGAVCVGGRVEVARDVTTAHHPRHVVTGALTAQLGWRAGGFAIVPGVAIGPSWHRIGGTGPHLDQSIDDASLRAGGRLGVQRSLGGAWAIELELAGDGALAGPGPALYRAAIGVHRGWW
jgi:hypothetical protein